MTTGVVAMLQRTFEWYGNNLHVIMRMLAEAHPSIQTIIIQNPQKPEVQAIGIVISGKAERMPGVKPAVVGMASCVSFMKFGFHLPNGFQVSNFKFRLLD